MVRSNQEMKQHWTVYSGIVEDAWDEEALNDCFADLIDDSLARGPEFLNYLLDGTVEFGPDVRVAGTQRDPLPYREEGIDRALDFTIKDDSKLVGFESKRGDSLSEVQLQDELEKLEFNATGQEANLVAVTDDWKAPGIIATFPEQVRWVGWPEIAQRVFTAEGFDETWEPTVSRAQKMFHAFGYRELDFEGVEDLEARIKAEQKRWNELFVTRFRPDNWSEEWTAKSRAGHIFKEGWRLDTNFEPTTRKAPTALQFVHHLRDEELVSRGLLKFQFRWDGGGDTEYRDRFATWFEEKLQTSDIDLSRWGIELSHSVNVFTEKIYEFDVEDFPYSFYETLREAFEQHQVIVNWLDEQEDVKEIVRD